MKRIALARNILFIAMIFFFISCRNHYNVDRAVDIFFIGVLQVLNMIFFGVIAVVFSVLAGTGGKPVFRTLGTIFLILFFLFALMGFTEVLDARPRSYQIYIIFLMELAMIIVAFMFVLKKPKINPTEKKRQSDLDQIINDNEVL